MYPLHRWELAGAGEASWAAGLLEKAQAYSASAGSSAVMIVHRRRVVAEWGDTTRRLDIASIRKSLLSALLGIAIEEGGVQDRRGRPLSPDSLRDLEPLNRLLERDERFARLAPRGPGGASGLELRKLRRWRSPESLLLPIGEALARLVCEEDFSYVKACEGPACTLLFADHTRGRARRWCSMAICGNRAKQVAHRHRLKARG